MSIRLLGNGIRLPYCKLLPSSQAVFSPFRKSAPLVLFSAHVSQTFVLQAKFIYVVQEATKHQGKQ